MRTHARLVAAMLLVATLAACSNVSGLSNAPRATFSQLACLDKNGDNRLNAADAADPSLLPDFNADHLRDAKDAAFLQDIDIPLNPQRDPCDGSGEPEYLVAHGYFDPSDVSCEAGRQAVLLVGVGGGVKNLKQSGDARGVRQIIDALQKKYDDRDVQTIGVISGQDMIGAENGNIAMEQWLTNAVRVYLDRFPCLRVVLVGHSHGGVTVDVIAARLEDRYASRFIDVVPLDRVDFAYGGDTTSYPQTIHVFNVYETNEPSPSLRGAPRDQPNVENWDASAEQAPEGGTSGKPNKPVTHVSIDNAKSVRTRIIDEVISRS
ncbi:MAG TPA: hypothetical protein VIH21_08435 [Dehalococcoidia bacterium]|jgi:hypothetical protein